jgi:prophage maintenance system killer protein
MADMFGVNPQAISKHIQNIYKEKELNKKGTSSKMELVQNESGRMVKRNVDIYDLDVVIAVGYRINSVVGTKFRQWATKTLREHITKGYTINRKIIAKNYDVFMKSVADIRALLPAGSATEPADVVELISLFADTWLSLDAYDKELIPKGKLTKKVVQLTGDRVATSLGQLKQSLVKGGQATDLFGQERSAGSVSGIVGNVMQSFGGKEVYPTAEEKAAHLLYFIVKNHPFVDGNKRSGAFSFVWYLRQAKILDTARLTPSALTALTIMVAESQPAHKEKVIRLILNLLSR